VGNKVNLRNMTARLCAICIVDEKGKRVFSDFDAESLGRKSAKALDRIFDVAQRLNGLGADDIKEMAKNSGRAIAADSTSGLAAHLKTTVRELLMRIDSRELSEWMAFYSIEPFGRTRADMRAAMVAFPYCGWRRGQRHQMRFL